MEQILADLNIVYDALIVVDEYINQLNKDEINGYGSILTLATKTLANDIEQLELADES